MPHVTGDTANAKARYAASSAPTARLTRSGPRLAGGVAATAGARGNLPSGNDAGII
jgi:hypothetical protein